MNRSTWREIARFESLVAYKSPVDEAASGAKFRRKQMMPQTDILHGDKAMTATLSAERLRVRDRRTANFLAAVCIAAIISYWL